MPLYSYECKEHGEFEVVSYISEYEYKRPCPKCNKLCSNVIAFGHGGIIRNDGTWLRDVSKILPEVEGERPFETIQDYKDYLKVHPNCVPSDWHPSLPSSVGDIPKPPTQEERKKKLKKAAMEHLVKDQMITVNSRTSVA